MTNVVQFPGDTTVNIEPNAVLDAAMVANLSEVVVVGMGDDGSFYFASSEGNGANTLWLLAQAQRILLEMGDPR